MSETPTEETVTEKKIVGRQYHDDGSETVTYSDGSTEDVDATGEEAAFASDSEFASDSVETIPEGELSYVLGNKHNPVLVLGDDPGNREEDERDATGAVLYPKQDNILVAHFLRVESVPRESVYAEEQADDNAEA